MSRPEPDQKTPPSNHVASPVRQEAASLAAGEQWYFRIDGKNFGPSSRSQLEHFLQPPRLCKTLEVMCTDRNGYWLTIGVDETIEMVLQRFGIPLQAGTNTTTVSRAKTVIIPKPSRGFSLQSVISLPIEKLKDTASNIADRLGPTAKKFGAVTVIAVALLICGSTAFVLMGGLRKSDSQILAQYNTIWKEATTMHGSSSAEQWREFADKSLTELEPTIRELSQSANVHNPKRQDLLFAGRDHLRKMLKAERPPEKATLSARVFERYLQLAVVKTRPT